LKKTIENLTGNPWVEWVARLFLGATFLYACFSKIVHPDQFAKIVYGYGLFPDYSINLIAIAVPWVEFVAALALLLGIYPAAGALLVNGMLLLYMVVLGINLARGHEFDCGCFSMGESHSGSSEELIIRDAFYFAVGLLVLFYRKRRRLCIRSADGAFRENPST
jgi:uncharacterized membrane protein YphA (DoxX/SURF4 family)